MTQPGVPGPRPLRAGTAGFSLTHRRPPHRRVRHRGIRRTVAALALSTLGLGMLASFAPLAGASSPPPGATSAPSAVGITVSWQPTSAPVQAIPGRNVQGHFWVTNQTHTPIPVTIDPATAVPGNNGALGIRPGADPRFSSVTYSPNAFVAPAKKTSPVTVTAAVPKTLGPGVYLIPAVVQPHPPTGSGNIHVNQEIVALVTVQIPGATNARVTPTYIGAAPRSGAAPIHHVPGFAPVALATSGSQTLQVKNTSTASFYAYNETTGSQKPFGKVVFEGHTAGDTGDLRTPARLYFPGRHWDFPLLWHPSVLGFGQTSLHSYVRYQPRPNLLVSTSATTSLWVISPWWFLVLVALVGLVALGAWRRARGQVAAAPDAPRSRSASARVVQVLGSGVLIVLSAAGAFLSRPWVFALTAAVGVALAVVFVVTQRRRVRPLAAEVLSKGVAVIGLLGLAAAVFSVLGALSLWPADLAMGLVSGAAVWALVAWWLVWWNEERPQPPLPEAKPQGVYLEPAPMAANGTTEPPPSPSKTRFKP